MIHMLLKAIEGSGYHIVAGVHLTELTLSSAIAL